MKYAYLAAVAGLAGAIGGTLLPGAGALALLGIVLDVQLVSGYFGGRLLLGARIVAVVHGALPRHGCACVGALVVVL